MEVGIVVILVAAAWVIVVLAGHLVIVPWLRRGPGGNALTGLFWRLARVWCRLVHRARFAGLEHVPSGEGHGGLIVVANHTGAIDPFLLQAACRFHIRWMMASEMMMPALDWFWKHQRTIPVQRDGGDTRSLREAIREVKEGGAVGIFPEGRIVRPGGELRPFIPGVGLLIARSKAPVLVAWIHDTPDTDSMVGSLVTPSRSRVVFSEIMHFEGERDAARITEALRQRLQELSGWPLNDEPMPPAEELENAADDAFI